MLPGNLQYWQLCRWYNDSGYEMKGTIVYNINEPIHFAGPSPADQSAKIEEEKNEQAKTSQTDQPPAIDQGDPLGATQHSSPYEITTPVKRSTIEETKQPEPSQTVEPAKGAAMSAPSVDAPPRVSQQPIASAQHSADVNQATL